MAITVTEKQESRPRQTGKSASAELHYVIKGTESDTDALAALASTAPSTYGGLVRSHRALKPVFVDITRPDVCTWEGIAYYAIYSDQEPPATGDSTFHFDTGGGVQHITQSLQTVGAYGAGGAGAPNFHGAIGVAGDNVEGVDINIPNYAWSETHYMAVEDVTLAYRLAVADLSGHVNDAYFKGFYSGQVLFLNAQGSRRSGEDWEITFNFASQPRESNITIPGVGVVTKYGWEYMWVYYKPDTDDAEHESVMVPRAVYMEQVYEFGNFALLNIG